MRTFLGELRKTSKFWGDGRFRVTATNAREGTRPIAVTRAEARRIIARFRDIGYSTHSPMGGVLWVVTEYCEEHGVPYKVEGEAGLGYRVTRKAARPTTA